MKEFADNILPNFVYFLGKYNWRVWKREEDETTPSRRDYVPDRRAKTVRGDGGCGGNTNGTTAFVGDDDGDGSGVKTNFFLGKINYLVVVI